MPIDKQKVNAAAQKYIQKGSYDKAIRELRKLVEDDPNDVRTLLKIGDLFTRKGENDAAIDTYYQVTGYYRERGFYLKAVAVLKQVSKLAPSRLDVFEDLGELYASQGLASDALSQYRQVLTIYQDRNQTADVQRVLERMCTIDPRNIGLRIKLAEHLSRAGSAEEAAEQFRIAAQQLKMDSRTDDYIRVAERLLFHRPDDERTLRELVEVYLEQGHARRGLGKLQKLYKIDPKNVDTLHLLTQAFIALNQNSKAASVLKELAKIQESLEPEAALGTWRRSLALTPNDPEVLAALQRHNFTLSGEVPRASANSAPDQSQPAEKDDVISQLLTECDSFIRLGLLNQALENIERIFELDSGSLEGHERRVAIYLKRGDQMPARDALLNMAKLCFALDRNRAVEYLAQAAELDPTHSESRELVMAFGLSPDDFGLHEPTQQRPRPKVARREAPVPAPRRTPPERSTADFPKLQLSDFELDEEDEPPPKPRRRRPPTSKSEREVSQVRHQLQPDNREDSGPGLNDGLDDMLGGLDFSYDFGGGDEDSVSDGLDTQTFDSGDEDPFVPELPLTLDTPIPAAAPVPVLQLDDVDDDDKREEEEPSFSLDLDFGGALDDFDFDDSVSRAIISDAEANPPANLSPTVEVPSPTVELPAPTIELSEAEAEILSEDLHEAEFFLSQGMLDEAKELVNDLVASYGAHPGVLDLKARVEAA